MVMMMMVIYWLIVMMMIPCNWSGFVVGKLCSNFNVNQCFQKALVPSSSDRKHLWKNIIPSLSDLERQGKEERNIKNDICQDHLISEMHCRFYNVEEKRIIVRSLSDLVRQGSKLLWRFGLGEENPYGVQVCLFRDGGYIRSWAFFPFFSFYKMFHNQ